MHMTASHSGGVRRVLQFSMLATALYVLATFLFGLRTHSLALLSESGHNLSDLLAIALSFFALYLQARPANDTKTFGYGRAGVLAAFVNALTLVVIAIWLALEALGRFHHPVAVAPRPMMLVATAGMIMNGVIAALLWRFSGEVNIRSVFIHMLGDTLSTAAVILGGGAIYLFQKQWIDPILSLLIAAVILWSSIGILRETLNILLEGTPRSIDLPSVRSTLQSIDGVLDVHDLHVWALAPNSLALASHLRVAEMSISHCTALRDRINHRLEHQFRIRHTTLQFEATGCAATHDCRDLLEAPAHTHDHDHSHFGHSH